MTAFNRMLFNEGFFSSEEVEIGVAHLQQVHHQERRLWQMLHQQRKEGGRQVHLQTEKEMNPA